MRAAVVPTEARNVQNRSRRQRVYLKSLVLELNAEFEQVKLDPEATQAFHARREARRGMLEEVRETFELRLPHRLIMDSPLARPGKPCTCTSKGLR